MANIKHVIVASCGSVFASPATHSVSSHSQVGRFVEVNFKLKSSVVRKFCGKGRGNRRTEK